ncbi:MAG: hypothetical protein DI600_03545 [Cutibacterium granulosum]|nr:MAG: hypothetical protein DI600_03545 [Cutibacterium granulosum]
MANDDAPPKFSTPCSAQVDRLGLIGRYEEPHQQTTSNRTCPAPTPDSAATRIRRPRSLDTGLTGAAGANNRNSTPDLLSTGSPLANTPSRRNG